MISRRPALPLAAAAFAAIVVGAGNAAGDTASAPQQPISRPASGSEPARPGTITTTHYGEQILLADAVSVLVGITMGSDVPFVTGYLAGGPIIHGVHGSGWRAAGSAGLRFGLPLAGVGVGRWAFNCNGEGRRACSFAGYRVGGLIGMGAAAAIDWIFLARKTESAQPTAALVHLGPVHAEPTLAAWASDRKEVIRFRHDDGREVALFYDQAAVPVDPDNPGPREAGLRHYYRTIPQSADYGRPPISIFRAGCEAPARRDLAASLMGLATPLPSGEALR